MSIREIGRWFHRSRRKVREVLRGEGQPQQYPQRQVSVLILVWSYSNPPFAIALPTERTEAILEGIVRAFEFFGCIPREVWWDNPKTVATVLLSGRDHKGNRRYAALASHDVSEPLFCMLASGNEKPVVENRVKTLQRRWGTPVPRVRDLAELNTFLRAYCRNGQSRPSCDAKSTIGERLEHDRRCSANGEDD